MTEENNVSQLSGANPSERTDKPAPDPRYAVREPSIKDAMTLAGIMAEGAENPQVFDAIDAKQNSAAMLFLFTGALRSPSAREGMMQLLADLWVKEVPDAAVENPHDDWVYEVSEQQVKNGAPKREERWRMISRKNRKRIVKQAEIGELPFSALMEFGRNLAALDSIADFLEQVRSFVPESSESSTTDSNGDTRPGATAE